MLLDYFEVLTVMKNEIKHRTDSAFKAKGVTGEAGLQEVFSNMIPLEDDTSYQTAGGGRGRRKKNRGRRVSIDEPGPIQRY